MKQFTAWRVRQLGDGVLEWTSPLGRTYIDQPPPLGVHFRPVDDAAQRGDPPDAIDPSGFEEPPSGIPEPDDDPPDDIPF